MLLTMKPVMILKRNEYKDPVITLAPPEPANKATLSPLMQRIMHNQKLAELVENHELA